MLDGTPFNFNRLTIPPASPLSTSPNARPAVPSVCTGRLISFLPSFPINPSARRLPRCGVHTKITRSTCGFGLNSSIGRSASVRLSPVPAAGSGFPNNASSNRSPLSTTCILLTKPPMLCPTSTIRPRAARFPIRSISRSIVANPSRNRAALYITGTPVG